ncbi:conserved hypothetical protein [Ricinus communis]|uniref:Uncharacterized protein n=1 Tax=Ricinus communis TaxID=3988 RepID=B9SR10_RICCO|nr:conserved hypothetical protein [Ricinus communis]
MVSKALKKTTPSSKEEISIVLVLPLPGVDEFLEALAAKYATVVFIAGLNGVCLACY